MKAKQNTRRSLGLVLACGIITFTAATHAVKPPKPPPEPPPAAPYNLIYLDDAWSFQAGGINEGGLVFGSTPFASGPDHSTLLVPQEENGSTFWFKDDDLNGQNDLLLDLGRPGWGALGISSSPYDMNDHGVIVGKGYRQIPGYEYYTSFAWFLAPQMINGGLTWAQLDADALNSLIMPLNSLIVPLDAVDDPYLEAHPMCINNHGEVALVIEQFWLVIGATGQRGYLLLPNLYEVSPEGAVAIEYPAEDSDGDGLNDGLISLGSGVRLRDGAVCPLLPQVINDRGDVAGVVWHGNWGSVGPDRPFVLRPRVDENLGLVWNEDQNHDGVNDLVHYLPLPTGATLASISDMNESGTIVGSVHYDAPKGDRAAVWQVDWETGTVTYAELEALGRYKISSAFAVNAAGQVVGRSLRYLSDGVDTKAWLWDANGVALLSDLVPPETGLADGSSDTRGINDSGMIVGSHDGVPFIAVPVPQP